MARIYGASSATVSSGSVKQTCATPPSASSRHVRRLLILVPSGVAVHASPERRVLAELGESDGWMRGMRTTLRFGIGGTAWRAHRRSDTALLLDRRGARESRSARCAEWKIDVNVGEAVWVVTRREAPEGPAGPAARHRYHCGDRQVEASQMIPHVATVNREWIRLPSTVYASRMTACEPAAVADTHETSLVPNSHSHIPTASPILQSLKSGDHHTLLCRLCAHSRMLSGKTA